jgi:sialate O-acetylesterase
MKQINILVLVIVLICFSNASSADVKLPKDFSSKHGTSARNGIPVWGWADAGERITVSFNGATVRTKATKNGKWLAELPLQKAGGPFT